MKQITIKTQAEYDALPNKFTEYTEIIIDATEPIYEIRTVPENADVTLTGQTVVEYLYIKATLWGNSQATLWGNSQATLRENSQATLWENSQATLRENSQATLWGNSQATLWGNSQATLWGNSQATLRENSQATLWENSQATLWENSQATLWENSQATLWGNSQVKAAFENSIIKAFSSNVIILRLKHQSTLICQNCNVGVQEKDNTANIIITKTMQHTKQTFLDIYKDSMTGNSIILYKSVNPDTLCDFYTGKIKYEGTVTCPGWDDNEQRECGGGLHLSPTPELALSYNKGKVLKCKVNIEDFVVYSKNIMKVRCKTVKVIGEGEK